MDNFDDVMEGMVLCVVYCVKNCLMLVGGEMGVDIEFKKFEDF